MHSIRHQDFLTTLSREFCDALRHLDGELCGQDAIEVFSSAFDPDLSVQRLRKADDEDYVRLTRICGEYLESEIATVEHFRSIIKNTLWHWAEDDP